MPHTDVPNLSMLHHATISPLWWRILYIVHKSCLKSLQRKDAELSFLHVFTSWLPHNCRKVNFYRVSNYMYFLFILNWLPRQSNCFEWQSRSISTSCFSKWCCSEHWWWHKTGGWYWLGECWQKYTSEWWANAGARYMCLCRHITRPFPVYNIAYKGQESQHGGIQFHMTVKLMYVYACTGT